MANKWVVKIIEYASGEAVKAIDVDSERKANQVERGLNINLNHDRFYTNVVCKAVKTAPVPQGA